MQKINLRDYYPLYTSDVFVEVPDEVADLLYSFKLQEAAYYLRTYRHKAFYSLDRGDGIEYAALLAQPSPADLFEHKQINELLYKGLATLSEKQRQRIYARFFLGMSNAAIARSEGCDITSVRDSIKRGVKQLKKFFEKNLQ